MNKAFPDAQVDDFSNLIGGITLPDADDRHVVAAAVRTEADVIVTFNLKDFPAEVLYPYGIEPIHPDAFVVGLIEHDALNVTAAIRRQIDSLRSPPLSSAQVLATLRKLGLTKSSDRLEALLG